MDNRFLQILKRLLLATQAFFIARENESYIFARSSFRDGVQKDSANFRRIFFQLS
jgi:hypothetical protein